MDAGADRLAERWATIRRQVDEACRRAGRNGQTVAVLPVSKTFSAETVRAAAELGMRRFGENRVQEIREKAGHLADCAIHWVVIGHLQTNKATDVARLASEVQSLDRVELAQALHRHLAGLGRRLDVLVQLKTSSEPAKTGLPPAGLLPLLDVLRGFDTLRVRGLMTLAQQSDDPEIVRACFRRLREARDEATGRGHDLPVLSMGMSGDFPLAIAEGATEVRIGSALFGERPA